MLDLSRPIQLRFGDENIRFLSHVNDNLLFIYIDPHTDKECLLLTDKNGRAQHKEVNYDVINIPEKIEGWVAVYSIYNNPHANMGRLFNTKEEVEERNKTEPYYLGAAFISLEK